MNSSKNIPPDKCCLEECNVLWHTCFPNDSDAFRRLYFDRAAPEAQTLCVRREGRLSGQVQAFLCSLRCGGHVLSSAWLSGLCVHPDFRRKGDGSRLLASAHQALFREKVCFSFLVPQDEAACAFYRRNTYAPVALRQCVPMEVKAETYSDYDLETVRRGTPELYTYYKRMTAGVPTMLLVTPTLFDAQVRTQVMEGGYVVVARKRNRLKGIAFVGRAQADGTAEISFGIYDEPASRQALSLYAKDVSKSTRLVYWEPMVPTERYDDGFAWARVVHVGQALKRYAKSDPSKRIVLAVVDNEIPENNATYRIAGGRVALTLEQPEATLTPATLAQVLVGATPLQLPLFLYD